MFFVSFHPRKSNSLLAALKKSLILHSLFEKKDGLILAVSGGVDSMVLLDLFTQLQPLFSLNLCVAHVNYSLRGQESTADASFVKERSELHGLPCETLTLPQNYFQGRGNLQAEARKVRYDFFVSLAKKRRVKKILVAHHADDQVETFFFRLLRGAGMQGLSAMQRISQVPGHPSLQLIRPLLFFTREQILTYARFKSLLWREDSSNEKDIYIRNRIRHEILEPLKQIQPQGIERVSQSLAILADENDWIEAKVEKFLKGRQKRGEALFKDHSSLQISLEWLIKQPLPLRYRMYRRLLKEIGCDLTRIQKRHLDALEQGVISGSKEIRVSLPQGFGARIVDESLVIELWRDASELHQKGFFR